MNQTALLWHGTGLAAVSPTPEPLKADELDRCWGVLAGQDAEAAFAVLSRLRNGGPGALRFLRHKLVPTLVTPGIIQRWINQLGDDNFEIRDAANNKLRALGTLSLDRLHQQLSTLTDPEARRGVQAIIEHRAGKRAEGDELRWFCLLHLLEYWDGDDSRRLLEEIARGDTLDRRVIAASQAIARRKAHPN
jgi:hypothetical protein